MLQLLITPAYWVKLYNWDRAFVADPTGMMIDFFWHGQPLIPLLIKQIIAPSDFTPNTVLGAISFGIYYLASDFAFTMYSKEVMYDQLPWDTDFMGALKFGGLLEVIVSGETLIASLIW